MIVNLDTFEGVAVFHTKCVSVLVSQFREILGCSTHVVRALCYKAPNYFDFYSNSSKLSTPVFNHLSVNILHLVLKP